MNRPIRAIATAAAILVGSVCGPGSAVQARTSGDTFACEVGRPAVSVRVPQTTLYVTFGAGLDRLTSQSVSPPQDPYAPGVYLQVAEAQAKPGHLIVETITKWAGPPTWDYWNGGQDSVHIAFALIDKHGPLVDYMINCVA